MGLGGNISPLAPQERKMVKKIKHYAWPTTHEQSEHMKLRQKENLAKSKENKSENWMYEKLKKTNYKWTRQARWGIRLFDFWCHKLGIAVEVDGLEHDKNRDFGRDKTDLEVSGILVLRVRNFSETDAEKVIDFINNSTETWNERRNKFGLKPVKY